MLFTKMVRIPKKEPKMGVFEKLSNFVSSSRALFFNSPKIGTKKSLAVPEIQKVVNIRNAFTRSSLSDKMVDTKQMSVLNRKHWETTKQE